ncbi:EcsC family protein [Bacillus tianshenii]|nr:EcsC family protein [Bacillus tianshenii]
MKRSPHSIRITFKKESERNNLSESKEILLSELKTIEEWESDQKKLWIWERIGRLPFKLLDRFTPEFIQRKIGVMLDELGNFIQNGGQYLTQEKVIFRKLSGESNKEITTYEQISELPLEVMKAVGESIQNNRRNVATVQGATTGVGGLFTLAIDIPVLLGMTLKTLQEIAIAHGYDPNERSERIFIVKCLQFASADIVGRQSILNELSAYYGEKKETKEMMSQLQGWREVVYTYRDQFGWKKLLQMVPIAGIIFGAFTNRSMINDISETGNMLYRKRRVLERLETSRNG